MRCSEGREAGQALVLFTFALVAIIAMTGLVLDGSTVFAQQRVAQNGSDAAALAGGLVIVEHLRGDSPRTNANVYQAIDAMADKNELEGWTAEYTNFRGDPTGTSVQNNGGTIPSGAWGVRVDGSRSAPTSFSRILGIESMAAGAGATALVGPTSTDCTGAEDPCGLLPITFPVQVYECDASGNLLPGNWIGAPPPGHEGEGYWPIVGIEALPSTANPTGDLSSLAILPLCKGSGTSTGAYGFLDFVPGKNLQQEIVGPLNTNISIPDWFQVQPGNPNSVDNELSAYIHKPVMIPLHNQACQEDPGATDVCPAGKHGVDPTGNNTWYYVHTIATFYMHEVLVQGSNAGDCASPPGSPLVPVTHGSGFLGCLKGWFVEYVVSGPINPDPDANLDSGTIGIQLIH